MNARERQVRRALARQGVFERGEVVRYVNDGGSSTGLDTHENALGPCEYAVIKTEALWIQVACLRHLDGGLPRKFPLAGPGIGSSYFRIVGPCGMHYPTFDHAEEGFRCARCDAPLPEALSRYWMSPERAEAA